MQRTGLPDLHYTIEDLIAEEDKVVSRWTLTGAHTGEVMGIPPSGNQVTITGILISRVASDKVVEDWGVSDQLGLMQQFGVIPAMGREAFTWDEPSAVTGDPGDPEMNTATVRRMIAEVWNKGNLPVVDEVFDTGYVLHDPAWPAEVRGPEGFKQYVAAMLGPFPDSYFTLEDIIAEGDKVAVRYTALGTHQGEFMSIPATGKQITITGTTIHRFADGKFVESWFSYDMLGFMEQLTAPPPVPEGFVVDQITSPSLEGNLLGDPATRRMTIYLPPGYDTSDKRYPVVYLLHGVPLGETAYLLEENWLNWVGVFFSAGPDFPENGFNGMLDDLIATGDLKEIIIVMPDATSRYSLSFYTNSDLSGNYEDYIANDLVSYIDSHYRTIPSRDGRAIAGHCEGGYGAMKLAMKHQEVFGAVASHSTPLSLVEWFKSYVPAVMAENPDGMTGPSPEKSATSLVYAMSAAFSPNLNNPPFFVDLPFEYPSGEIVDEVWNRWLEYDPLTMLNTYGASLDSLRGVYIDCGNQDEIGVTPHVEAFHQALDAAGIKHEYEIYDGTHCNKLYSRLATSLRFLSDALVAEEELEDYTNVFFTSLKPGLNMVSLPLKPITPYTARSFAEEIGATVVIKLDEGRQRFVGFTLDAPDDGFAIEGGKGYIVNVPEGRVVAFTGAAWTNEPPVEAAPILAQTDGAWAFVVSGRFEEDSQTSEVSEDFGSFYVTIRNTGTKAVATDVVRSGYFAAAFADLNRKNVVQTGDRLEVQVRNQAGEIVSDTFTYTVTADAIHQAFLPITLKNVEIPRQSLLLQNYPNPFNPETWIPYQLRKSAEVVIRIYDSTGRLVRTLDLGQHAAGFYLGRTHAAYWDGHNDIGEKVSSGIYFYQIKAGDFNATRRMVIVK